MTWTTKPRKTMNYDLFYRSPQTITSLLKNNNDNPQESSMQQDE